MIESLISYIKSRIKVGYEGAIKIGFEKGTPVTIAEFNNPDINNYIKVPDDFNFEKLLHKININYYGQVSFVITNKKIILYSQTQTYQGFILNALLKDN